MLEEYLNKTVELLTKFNYERNKFYVGKILEIDNDYVKVLVKGWYTEDKASKPRGFNEIQEEIRLIKKEDILQIIESIN